jgi:hypothetical protein
MDPVLQEAGGVWWNTWLKADIILLILAATAGLPCPKIGTTSILGRLRLELSDGRQIA